MSYAKNNSANTGKRKNRSIRTKVVAWFAVFVVLIAGLAMAVVYYAGESSIQTELEAEIQEVVLEFAEDLEWRDGTLIADDFYEDDVMLSVYDNDGVRIAGAVPSSFPRGTTLKNGKIQRVSAEDSKWMTYDFALDDQNGGYIWVRGVMYVGWASFMQNGVAILMMIIFPGLIALAVIGGYLIMRRAFAPVEYIRTTAENIAASGDLSRRVPMERTAGELRELADTFNYMLDALQQAFEDEKQFSSDVSHELRTPVSVIIAQGEYALLDDVDDEERREAIAVMLDQARKISELISQMLFMARREQRRIQLEAVDLCDAARVAAESYQQQAQKKRVTIEVDAPESVYVQADATGLSRIAGNLIENAVEYGKPGGHVWVRVYREKEEAVLRVRDDGMGIAPKHLDHIFKRFYRADAARTADEKNHTGLGLAMVKLLAETYGGSVSADSQADEGTEFIVRIPIGKEDNLA